MRRLSLSICTLILVGSLSGGGCATVLRHSGPETITITSEPPAAKVTVINLWSQQPVLQATTPAIASLARHAGYMQPARYQVVVEKPGYQPYSLTLQATVDERYFGNMVAGGPIGMLIVDPLTGAMYALPRRVHAVLTRADAVGAPSYAPPPSQYAPPSSPYSAEPLPYPSQSPPSPYESPLYRALPPEERVR